MLVEASKICSGTTQNTTAKITVQHGLIYDRIASRYGVETAKMYWNAQQNALAWYREIAKEIPCEFETM